jgi:hypothetical protein
MRTAATIVALAVAGCGVSASSDDDATDSSTSSTGEDPNGTSSTGDPPTGATLSSGEPDDATTSGTGQEDSASSEGDPPESTDSTDSDTGSDEGSTGGLQCSISIDQASTDEDDHLLYPPWQSFTAGRTGDLVEIDAMPNTYCGGNGIDGDLTIYEGEGTGGVVLFQEPYAAVPVGGIDLVTFLVDPPVPVVAGNQYTFELSGTCGLRHSSDNPYPGGVGGGVASIDMVFATRVETCE